LTAELDPKTKKDYLVNMAKSMVGFRCGRKLRKRLKRLAWEDRMTVSTLVEVACLEYVRSGGGNEEEDDESPNLADRADDAAIELESIVGDTRFLDYEEVTFNESTVEEAAGHLEQLAIDIREAEEAAAEEDDDDDFEDDKEGY